MRRGTATLPLHYGKAPAWLFKRMAALSREITRAVVEEFGPGEFLRRISDPGWFQALGCVLGFDWHSSGVTTTVCGALKEGLRGLEGELGLFVAGGKGAASRKTPSEIETRGRFLKVDPARLVYASRLAAKVDSAALQDGYHLYHHTFFFTASGAWSVVQQGMNTSSRSARRYHWLGRGTRPETRFRDFVCEPHSAVCCDRKEPALNLVDRDGASLRESVTELACQRPDRVAGDLKRLKELNLPSRHNVLTGDINPSRIEKVLLRTYETGPDGFEALIATRGVGPATLRALTLLSELVYGVEASYKDPVSYSFAHGGKDGTPYPVDRKTYDRSIEFLRSALERARLGRTEKKEAFRRLALFDGRGRRY